MRNLRILAALGLLGAASAASAGVSSTITLTSDYDFRGLTQTNEDPALQASFDYEDENSGWYAGAWASNVDFGPGDPNYEIDLITGFRGGDEEGLGWDAGFVYYAYPEESDINFPEIFGGVSYGMFSGKVWYTNDFGGSDDDAIYLQGDAEIPLPANLTLNLHAGYSFGDFWDNGDSKYMDYSVGVGYTIEKFDLALKYVDTDLDGADTNRLIFSISTQLPW